MPDLDLTINISDLKVKNPFFLASGILGTSIKLLRRVYEAGAGALVTKSIGRKERNGYNNPTIVESCGGYINAVGLSNPGIDEFYKELLQSNLESLPLIVSLFGAEPSEFSDMIKLLNNLDVKAYELNLSCPHAKGLGLEVCQDLELVKKIIRTVKRESTKPVFVKLSPMVTDIVNTSIVAEESGADALTIANTFKAMAIDIDTGRPILANKIGGLSGPAIKPIAIRCVYEIYEKVKIPIIGCGGAVNWQDIVEFFLAGASAIQIGTAIAYEGFNVFKNIENGIRNYMDLKGIRSLRDFVGKAHSFR